MNIEIKAGFEENELDAAIELMKFLKGNEIPAKVKKETKEVTLTSTSETPVKKEEPKVANLTENATAPEEAKAYTKEDVRDKAKDVLTKKGPEVLMALLQQFNAPNAMRIPEEKRAEFMAAADKELENA